MVLEEDKSTGLDIADPLVGAHDKVVHIENVIFVLAKEQLTALSSIHNKNNVVLSTKPCNRF